MGNGITDFMDGHPKTATTSKAVVVSITLAKLGKKIGEEAAGKYAAILVQPAIWIVKQQKPDGADVAYWLLGSGALLAGEAILGYATAGAKIVKSMVDDNTQKLLQQVRSNEPAEYRNGIRACCNYESFAAGQGIEAAKIASYGGTAWLHPNGLWVYLSDANKHLVCDYKPNAATTIYQPLLPLRPTGNGRFKWNIVRG